jgi:hypothetical protein
MTQLTFSRCTREFIEALKQAIVLFLTGCNEENTPWNDSSINERSASVFFVMLWLSFAAPRCDSCVSRPLVADRLTNAEGRR